MADVDGASGQARPDPRPLAGVPASKRANAVAALAAGTIATMVGLGHNYWAMVAAVAPIAGPSLSPAGQEGRAPHPRNLRRVWPPTGLLLAPHPAPWVLVLMVIVLQFAAEMFVLRHYALALIFITPLALIMTRTGRTDQPGGADGGHCALQTAIGALVGISLVYLMHQRTLRKRTGAGSSE